MPNSGNIAYEKLHSLLISALASSNYHSLEEFMKEKSGLPGPRLSLTLIKAFAIEMGNIITQDQAPVDQIEGLLDGWAALSVVMAPSNHPAEILPAAAVFSYGKIATIKPGWWEDETNKIYKAALNPRWRTRDMAAAACQLMLLYDWKRTVKVLENWILDPDLLVVRAALAAVADPPLLRTDKRAREALELQKKGIERLESVPVQNRRDENVNILRKTLGFTVSIAAAAYPGEGIALLAGLLGSHDLDLQWIAHENMGKKVLKPLLEQIEAYNAEV